MARVGEKGVALASSQMTLALHPAALSSNSTQPAFVRGAARCLMLAVSGASAKRGGISVHFLSAAPSWARHAACHPAFVGFLPSCCQSVLVGLQPGYLHCRRQGPLFKCCRQSFSACPPPVPCCVSPVGLQKLAWLRQRDKSVKHNRRAFALLHPHGRAQRAAAAAQRKAIKPTAACPPLHLQAAPSQPLHRPCYVPSSRPGSRPRPCQAAEVEVWRYERRWKRARARRIRCAS